MSSPRFRFEIDAVDQVEWEELIDRFDDASLYQTWAFAASPAKSRRLSHVVMKSEDDPVGCCQVRIRLLGIPSLGMADVNWGPLCLPKGREFDPDILAGLLRKIKEEYGIKRRYFVRIMPHLTGEKQALFKSLLEAEGFRPNTIERPYRTYRIDLSPSEQDLRSNLLQKWRNGLNRAERNDLRLIEGTGDDLFATFAALAEEMCQRKGIVLGVDHARYRRVQKELPESHKMRIMICEANARPVGAVICSAIGDTGIYLLGATGEDGLKLNCSYLLQWRMLLWTKNKGMHYYDVGAFNRERNPGVFHFKQGIAGKTASEDVFLNEYDGSFSFAGRIAALTKVRQAAAARAEKLKDRVARNVDAGI